jgi:hypothetical protein
MRVFTLLQPPDRPSWHVGGDRCAIVYGNLKNAGIKAWPTTVRIVD